MIAPHSYSNRRGPSHTAWAPPLLFVVRRRIPTAPVTSRCTRYVAMHPLRRNAPVTSQCTRYVALHPLRRAAPVTSRCTRSEEVQCLQIGCTASHNKPNRGHSLPTHHNRQHRTQPHGLDMLTPTPNERRYTRYVAMHPLRGAAPDQKGCNAYGSGAPPPTTSPTAGNLSPQTPTAGNSSPQTPTVRPGRCDTASTCSPGSEREALHPLRRNAPVTSRYTRSEGV